jgi:hypothetical protein
MRFALLLAAIALGGSGCTVVSTARTQSDTHKGMFVTQSDLSEPYQSLGPLQATRKGIIWFGIDFAGTSLEEMLNEAFVQEIARIGGDGAINVRYIKSDTLLITRILLFLVPLPSETTITGEVVKLTGGRR